MTAQEILNSDEFKKCLDFHGHLCPGLSIGYKAAIAGMEKLKAQRSEDEELVAIVETDACCADAVQVMTGCTFGKGNFIYHDHGKMVFSFISRESGKGIRVSMRPDAFIPDGKHMKLMQKVMAGTADNSQKKRFYELHRQRSLDVLNMNNDELFELSSVQLEMPKQARIDKSIPCGICGEPTMRSKMIETDNSRVCRDCHGKPGAC